MKKMVMMCAVCVAALCARAALPEGGPYTEVVDGIEWTFMVDENLEASVGVGTGSATGTAVPQSTMGDIIIPDSLGGRTVTSIRYSAFYCCSKLTSVTIPANIHQIGRSAFYLCSGIEKFIVATDNADFTVQNQMLCDKRVTTVIQCPAALEEVTIPASVTSVEDAFVKNSLTRISVEKGSKYLSVRNQLLCNKDGSSVLVCPRMVLSVIIPEGVKNVERNAFYCCDSMTSVLIPSTLQIIGWQAFYKCRKLSEIDIPYGVSSIGSHSFWGSGLVDVEVPASVTEIGSLAFANCNALKTATVAAKTVGDDAFRCCGELENVILQGSVSSIGNNAFFQCEQLASISIPSSVTSIDRQAFYLCQALSVVHVESGDSLRVRAMLEDCLVFEKSVADQVTIIEDYDPEPGPVPPEPEPEEGFEEAHTFNGLVYAGEVMCGIVQVTTGKRTAKDQVKVGGFVMLADGKKQTIKSVTEDIEGGKLNVETKAGKLGEMELEITDSGFTGSVGLMTVKSGDVGENTGIISGTLKMSYFDAKTNKLKTRSIKLGGVASGGEAAGTLETKGEPDKTFEAVIE